MAADGTDEVSDLRIALTSMEQMLPFQTTEDLLPRKREGVVSVTPGMTVLVEGVLSVRDLMAAMLDRNERWLRRMQEEQLRLLVPDPIRYGT